MTSILQVSLTFFMMCFHQHADAFPSFQTLIIRVNHLQVQELYTHNIGLYEFHSAENADRIVKSGQKKGI